MYASNPQNFNFDDLPFDCDEMLITGQLIYYVNDDIIFRLKNGSNVNIYTNQM